ncbi:TetR/AcrR family transcriptional regulator [Saccharomonospora iraqiensis]|uniref:TetR/AcrR family transcriptional regulator n=1 Tax=Saccharomonospora iraqiensis TaxID=52698 RepID=UPI00040DD601|nr:TetR/AcrR family transcriptional regulator [Saccharomonospora iraqiensis]
MITSTAECPACARLRAAVRVIMGETPLREVTADELADAAGTDVRMFTRHYPSVRACGEAAFEEVADDLHRVCAAAMTGDGPDCAARFTGVAEAVLRWADAHPQCARYLFVVSERAAVPELRARSSGLKRSVTSLFDGMAGHTPAGRIHVEFVVGLFFRAAAQALAPDGGGGHAALRRKVLALSPFVGQPTGGGHRRGSGHVG